MKNLNKLFTAQKLKVNAMTHLKNVVVGLLLTLPLAVDAQQINEKDVVLQEKFIDANRERILGNLDKAIPLYEEILKEDPDNHAVAYELARVYDTRDEGDKALELIRKAIAAAPDNEWYQRFLADVYQKQGKNQEAAALYESLAKKEPNNDYYYHRWAYFLVRANDISKALKVYDDLEKRTGIHEELIRRKHALYVGMGNNKKAADELERLIAVFPNNVDYYHLLAGFYEQIGEEDLAKQIYRRLVTVAPEDAKATMALAGTPKGSSNAASDEVQHLRSLRPVFEKPEVSLDLKIQKLLPFINKVMDSGDSILGAVVLELTQVLEAVHNDEARAYAASGNLWYALGNPAKALEKYEKTLQLDDTVFPVWEQLLHIQQAAGEYEALRKSSENAMDIFPNKAFLYYMNGIANDELNEPEEALRALEQATRMAGNDEKLLYHVYIRRGIIYNYLKQNESSNSAFEQALKLNAKGAEVLNAYSYALALRGENLEKAKTMTKQANDLAPNTAAYQATYGWTLYKLKEYKSAKEWLDKSLKNGGDQEAIILEHYGDVLFQLNDTPGAIQYWTKAQDKGGASQVLKKKITDRKLYE
jgi:tetratricopeptide (TPR) repeat protein